MRKLIIIPCVIAAFVAGGCGGKHSQSGDANAAEGTTVSPEGASVSTSSGPVTAGTGAFDGAPTPSTEKRYDQAGGVVTSYTREELGDSTGAIEALKRAIVLDGRDAWSMNNLAKVYIRQGRFEDALGPLARAIEIDSTVTAFHTNLGRALERTADRGGLAAAFVEQVKTWR